MIIIDSLNPFIDPHCFWHRPQRSSQIISTFKFTIPKAVRSDSWPPILTRCFLWQPGTNIRNPESWRFSPSYKFIKASLPLMINWYLLATTGIEASFFHTCSSCLPIIRRKLDFLGTWSSLVFRCSLCAYSLAYFRVTCS